MQPLFDDTTFVVQFPVWMLLHETALSRGLITVNGPDGERGFPLFTDQDLADRFKASIPKMGAYTLGIAKDRDDLKTVIKMAKAKGFTHVSIDPTNARTRFVPISEVVAALHKGRAPDTSTAEDGDSD